MKKMKKLLSVLLAVILSLSCMSVMASAAITPARTVADLETLEAYSPYGTVTRLSTEERMSLVLDFLDNVLKPLNINMGQVVNLLGITITIDLTSVNGILTSLDSFKTSMSKGLWSIAAGIVNLGVLEELTFDAWETGMTREKTAQLYIVEKLLDVLAGNTKAVNSVLTNGIELGLVANFLSGLDLSGINKIVKDLPGLVKGLIFPLFERWDHTTEDIETLENALKGDGQVLSILEKMVREFFTRPQSMTTVKADANGVIDATKHELPTEGTRQKYKQDGDTITVSHYYTQSDVDKDKLDKIVAVGYMETGSYKLDKEYDSEDAPYVFKLLADDGSFEKDANGQTISLKYYEKDSYWLPDFAAELKAGTKTFSITTESGAVLLYKMIPYVFDAMAPTVVNGSLKKILAEFFGTQFIFVGNVKNGSFVADDKLTATEAIDKFGLTFTDSFFTEAQGEYLWEWSNYKVIDGKHFYRFEDQVYYGDTTKSNDYFNIINWNFKITGDFLNEFVPSIADLTAVANGTAKSTAGYTRILHGVNDFLCKLADTVLAKGNKDLAGEKTFTYTITKGDNSKLVDNIKAIAQAILGFHPEHIFGATYDKDGKITSYGSYYSLIMKENNDDLVLTGIAALVIDALAPQMHLPDAASLEAQNVKVGGLLAAMLRELATQLVPSINYDKLIYSDYNKMTFVSDKDNSYWLDVLLTIGTDIGFKYLTALADLDEDKLSTYFAKGGSIDWQLSREYTEADLKLTSDVNLWEQRVDFIIDWALYVDADGTFSVWNMGNFVDGYLPESYDMENSVATIENPWAKLDAIFDGILFFDQFTSETDLETALRGTILDLVNLNWENILGTDTEKGLLDIPASSKLRTTNLVDALSLEIKDLVNGLFKNVGGGSYSFIPDAVKNLDQLAMQANIKTLAVNLLAALPTAFDQGLLTTVLPIVNIFLGWTTDPQKYATPSIYTTDEYIYVDTANSATTGSTTFNIINNSAGMLLKHRAANTVNGTYSSVVDKPYTLKITSIESDVAGVSYDKTSVDVAPYGTASITATVPYSGSDYVARFVITYSFMGKDGTALGGENKMVTYMLVSNTKFNNTMKSNETGAWSQVADYGIYVLTKDLYESVVSQTATVSYFVDGLLGGSADRLRIAHMVTSAAPTGTAAEHFKHVTTESGSSNPQPLIDAGWDVYFGGKDTTTYSKTSSTGRLYLPKSDTTKDVEFDYGLYDLGIIEINVGAQDKKNCKYDSSKDKETNKKYIEHDFYYYTDHDVDVDAGKYTDKQLLAEDFSESAQDEFVTYEAALKNVVELAQFPVTLNYNETIAPQIEGAVKALTDAYDALMKAEGNANASAEASDISGLEAQLAKDDGDGEVEINFQDYALFEYFEYQDYRTANRNLVKTFYAPEVLVGGYIKGSGITYAELQDVITAEQKVNANKATAITNTITEYTEEEIAASKKAHDEFVTPVVDELYISDQISRLDYYIDFVLPVAADLDFITTEIGYANANYPINDETKALYTEDSWNAYVDAHSKATAITASDIPSVVFDAKFNLMRAMKNLLLKADSAIEAGATAKLIDLAAKAEDIFEMNYDEIELSEVAIAKGLTKDEALGHLLFGLGYYYEGEDGNTWNLYDNSAYEYIDNDRPNKSTNIDRINACAANLEACLAYFKSAEVIFDGINDAIVHVTTEVGAALEKGYIYGFGPETNADTFVKDYLKYENCTVEVVANAAGFKNGTGAIVKTFSGATQVGEYTIVVFGDVDGNAEITANDRAQVSLYNGGATSTAITTSAAAAFAADVDANGEVTANDRAKIALYNAGATGQIANNIYAVS